MNAQATYDVESGRFEGRVEFSEQFDLVNGKYRVRMFALDSSAAMSEWNLGRLDVWFKEGQTEANN